MMIGTPEYMSPEQVEGKEIDQRSDIYSLGVNLYEMVTGQVPFEGDTPFTIGVKHKSETPKDPSEINAQIPGDLNRLILRCMEKDREKRYQHSGEVRSELENIEKGIPTTERVEPKRKPITSKEITVKFDLKKVFISAFIIIILVAIAVYFLISPDRIEIDVKIGTTKQLSYEAGLELDPNISSDGKMVAFATGPLGKTHLVVILKEQFMWSLPLEEFLKELLIASQIARLIAQHGLLMVKKLPMCKVILSILSLWTQEHRRKY